MKREYFLNGGHFEFIKKSTFSNFQPQREKKQEILLVAYRRLTSDIILVLNAIFYVHNCHKKYFFSTM